jgi:hypothetical protein
MAQQLSFSLQSERVYWMTMNLNLMVSALDIEGVQCLVGHVRDGNSWAIVDWSGSLAHATYKNNDIDD